MTLNLDGLIPATVLPMHADGTIDEPSLRSYIERIAAQGPVALAINVDTGEGPHLTQDEKVRVLRIVREVTDLPIVAGLAGPSTDAALQQARDFKAAGADALLVFPIPAYLSEPLDIRVPVAYHQAMLSRRQRKTRLPCVHEHNGSVADRTPAPWLQAAAQDDARRLRELLEQLPPNQREVIRQRIYEGKRFREIAATLHCPLNTALARMHEGLKRLRLLWGKGHA